MKFRFLGKAVLAVFIIGILGWVVSFLWNTIVPGLFDGAHTIGYWHALGLLLLSRILFGGFRGRGLHRGHGREMWRRWESMSPEEREAFRSKTSRRWGQRYKTQSDNES